MVNLLHTLCRSEKQRTRNIAPAQMATKSDSQRPFVFATDPRKISPLHLRLNRGSRTCRACKYQGARTMQGLFSRLATSVPLVAVLAWGCSDSESAKRSFLERGSAYMAEGRVREAITQFRNAIEAGSTFWGCATQACGGLPEGRPVASRTDGGRARGGLVTGQSRRTGAGGYLAARHRAVRGCQEPGGTAP